MATQTFTAGTSQALKTIAELGFSKAGFNFAGWGTAKNAAQSSYADGSSYTATADTTLYALWSAVPVYNVTVSANNNGTVTATPATATAGTEITLAATPNTGYEFVSYTVTAADGSSVTVTDGKFLLPSKNVTVTATFNLHIPADGFVVAEVDESNIVTVIKNATHNTRLMLKINGLSNEAKSAINESSYKFIFDFTKSDRTEIYPKHHFSFDNTNVVGVVFSDKITIIGDECFDNYKGLKELVIPKNITEIGVRSFRGLALDKLTIECPTIKIGNAYTFYNTSIVELVTTNTSFLSSAKNNIANLEKITILPGAKVVAGNLSGNTKITSIVIPDGVEEIGDYALHGDNLIQVTLPKTIKKIGKYAFSNNLSRFSWDSSLNGSYWYSKGYRTSETFTTDIGQQGYMMIFRNFPTEPWYRVNSATDIPEV